MNDEVMCNFGHYPFVFDLRAYQSRLVSDRYNEVKTKPVELDTVYTLVKNYLSSMGYVETLQAFDENREQKELHVKKEDTDNAIKFDSPSLARKMTIDQADNSTSEKKQEEEY